MDMTWREFDYRSRAFNRSIERGWERTRLLASIIINSAPFRKKGRNVKPQDIIKLSIDENRRRKKPLLTVEEYLELIKKFS
jgi:hypothetical protein